MCLAFRDAMKRSKHELVELLRHALLLLVVAPDLVLEHARRVHEPGPLLVHPQHVLHLLAERLAEHGQGREVVGVKVRVFSVCSPSAAATTTAATAAACYSHGAAASARHVVRHVVGLALAQLVDCHDHAEDLRQAFAAVGDAGGPQRRVQHVAGVELEAQVDRPVVLALRRHLRHRQRPPLLDDRRQHAARRQDLDQVEDLGTTGPALAVAVAVATPLIVVVFTVAAAPCCPSASASAIIFEVGGLRRGGQDKDDKRDIRCKWQSLFVAELR